MAEYDIPRIPASAGALIHDGSGRLLILKPTYKAGWTVPGGQLESTGESPWEGCQREVTEETGLVVTSGRLVCVDFLRPKAGRPGGLRFLFDCGVPAPGPSGAIVLQEEEISEYRWVSPDEAGQLLSGPVGRRVAHGLTAAGTRYLEEGRVVTGVGG
jgi:8-oxo-dGTP pyrophosphatase MutT (NUDIX family)